MMFNFILGLNFLRRNKMYTNPKVKQVPSVLNARGWFMKSKRQEKANQFNSRGCSVHCWYFKVWIFQLPHKNLSWNLVTLQHWISTIQHVTHPRVVQSNRNRAKLGRALHKLRSSFAVNPRYKFHHFFEPFLLLKLLVFAKSAHKLQRVYRDEYTTELSYDFIVVNRTIFQ